MQRYLRFLRPKPEGPVAEDEKPVADWTQNLVLFFRVLAVFQIAKGLVHWGLLIAQTDPGSGTVAVEYISANIYFAVLDSVAGVGLWLTSSWGAVLWLLAAVSLIAICIGFPEIFGFLGWLIAFEVATIVLYVFLTWKVAQVSDD